MSAKTCWSCGIEKPLEDFHRNKRMRDGHLNHCRECWNARLRAGCLGAVSPLALRHREQKELRSQGLSRCIKCGQIKPLEEGFYRNAAQSTGWSAECKQCDVAATIARQQADPEAYAARLAAWRKASPERAAANARKGASARRARLREVFVEQIDPFTVYDRDAGQCGLCTEDVPRDQFDIDHIVPLALGGEHSYANVRLAHVSCNRRRGRLARSDQKGR